MTSSTSWNRCWRKDLVPRLFPGDQRGRAGDVQAARPHRQGDPGRHPARGHHVLHQEQPRRGHAGQAGGRSERNQAVKRERLKLQKVVILLAAVLFAPLAFSAELTSTLGNPRTMKFDSVTFTIPEVERIVLENGIIVYLLPDPELPLVTVSAMIRTGAIYEPPDKVGLAALTGSVMRTR